MKIYRISSWDHENNGWSVEATGLTLFGLRPAWRELRARGYDDDLSILIESE